MRKIKSGLSWFLTVTILLSASILLPASESTGVYANELSEYSEQDVVRAYELLLNDLDDPLEFYRAYRGTDEAVSLDQEIVVSPLEAGQSDVAQAGYQETITYQVDVATDGYYRVLLNYHVSEEAMNNLTLSLLVNGEQPFQEAATLDVPLIWRDESKSFTLDSYGDEALPNQVRVDEWRELNLYNNTYSTTNPIEIFLTSGSNELRFTNLSADPLQLGGLTLPVTEHMPSYESYRADLETAGTGISQDLQTINAISYTEKNSSFIRLASQRNPVLDPYDPVDRKINIIDGGGWNQAGQSITYSFEVPADGDYEISFHYLNAKADFTVFRTIEINGEILFDEMKEIEFPFTNRRWANITLSDETGEAFLFRLAEGEHTIKLTATQGLIAPAVDRLQLLINHINQFSLEIRKITGRDIDRNRTWRLTQYLPETEAYLDAYELLILSIVDSLAVYAPNARSSATLSFLNKALAKLEIMQEKPDELPLYFEDLYSGNGSVTQMVGETIDRLNDAGMSLSAIYLSQDGAELPAEQAGIPARVWGSIQSFLSTFTSDKYVIRNEDTAVNVWVSRPITYVDIMQKQVDAEFTPATGIDVKLSVMPDANKLILANAAGNTPDIALGLPSYMPYDIAIRGAAYPLTQFDDFWTVAARSTPGAFIPYVFDDEIYALPETLDFQALVYRKDVFDSLGLAVPDTWDEVIGMLPVLQRYGMNFYHTIAGGVATKWFYQTSPFIYQFGGQLYEENGYYSAIDEAEAVQGLSYLTDLFTTYSLPVQVPNFYNSFRYNELPIGMIDFNTYLQIQNAAPELKGQWALADLPGIRQADGSVSRWFIANGTGAVIMDRTDKPDDAWAFLKWWTSTATQTEYANVLSSTYGPEFVWLSGNLQAAANSPIPEQDKEVILRQIPWLRDVPRTPGQYMLERGLSDVWSQAVQDGLYPRVAIDQQMITINREIRRKMMEFGFIDQDGNELRPYQVRDIDWIEEQMTEAGTWVNHSADSGSNR